MSQLSASVPSRERLVRNAVVDKQERYIASLEEKIKGMRMKQMSNFETVEEMEEFFNKLKSQKRKAPPQDVADLRKYVIHIACYALRMYVIHYVYVLYFRSCTTAHVC